MILALAEHDGKRVDSATLEVLAFARDLAERAGTPLETALFGGSSQGLVEQLASQGITVIHAIDDERLGAYAPAAWGDALARLVRACAPGIVVGPSTDRGSEVLAYAASRLGAPFAANCVDVTPGPPLQVVRQRWGGSLLEESEVLGELAVVGVAPHVVPAGAATGATHPEVRPFDPSIAQADLQARLVGQVPREAGRVSLAEARVVVGGGRGVGSAASFAMLDELAALLRGTVGVSRVVTSNGWRPHAEQVGQTGARIAPELYIACGISGAIQHMVGARSAKRILAINTDPDAPMVQQATWAVLGDLHAVVPALTSAVRQRLAASTAARPDLPTTAPDAST